MKVKGYMYPPDEKTCGHAAITINIPVLYLFLIFISQKGFPIKISLDKLIAFFAKLDVGEVDTVFMRRNPNRDFKVSNGRIFLTFLRGFKVGRYPVLLPV